MELMHAGIGVSTRTGAARFVTALADRLPAAVLQKPAGEFLKALLPALRAERRAVTQRALAAATGAMAKCASGKRLEWLVGEVSNMMDLGANSHQASSATYRQYNKHGCLGSTFQYLDLKTPYGMKSTDSPPPPNPSVEMSP